MDIKENKEYILVHSENSRITNVISSKNLDGISALKNIARDIVMRSDFDSEKDDLKIFNGDNQEIYYWDNCERELIHTNNYRVGLMDREKMYELDKTYLLDLIVDLIRISETIVEKQDELICDILTCLKDDCYLLISEGIKISKDKEGRILIDRKLS